MAQKEDACSRLQAELCSSKRQAEELRKDLKAARAEVAAVKSALQKAEAQCSAAEQTLKEERAREGSVHQFQQVQSQPCLGDRVVIAAWPRKVSGSIACPASSQGMYHRSVF